MKYKIKNNYLLITLCSVFFFLFALPANAAVWGVALALAIPLLLWFVQAGIFLVAIKIIHALSGKLINWGINAQGTFLNLDLIQTIWTVLRDFVNIFFILILLVIAFATVFNKPTEYTAKELLPKLIIAALLINFSLVTAVWVIDLLWVPAQVFLNPFTVVTDDGQKTYNLSENIAQALNVQKFYRTTFFSRLVDAVTGRTPFANVGAIEEIFRTVLLFIEAYVFAWIALIIWARIPILLGLMIVSPLAWLGLAFPTIRKQTWDTWWQKLFCWGAIPIPLLGLIYFVILFNQKLSLEVQKINDTIPNSWYRTGIEALGLQTGEFIIWLLTISVFLLGLWYVKNLSCSLGGLVETGFKKTWGGVGRGVGFAYTATGAGGAVGRVQKEFKEGGIPIFGARRFGTAQREARETRVEDWLRTRAGLPSTFAAQRNVISNAEKEAANTENRIKQAGTTDELKKIIDELRETAWKGTPEGLAALTILAKRGELDVSIFNQAIDKFKDMPLTLSKVMSEWKEGKFGGLTAGQFMEVMRDEKNKLPIDARRIMYSFAASEDGKKTAEKFEYKDFDIGVQILGRNTKAGRDYFKFWGDSDPLYVAKYKFDNRTDRIKSGYDEKDLEKIQSLQDAIIEQMKRASVKNVADHFYNTWAGDEQIDGIKMGERFEGALAAIIRTKDEKAAEQFINELRRRLRREGKDKQLEILNGVIKDIGKEYPEKIYAAEPVPE